jgi:pyruvate/2-oxoglutarate dehydrogenase complex dihydrolipoamide dehydrogenase (E3) component
VNIQTEKGKSMAKYEYDIGVIGAGAAGLTVAAGAAQLGAKTLLVEKNHDLGGDCLHYGCVPSKTLIRSARVYQLMKNAAKYGLPKVETKQVDFRKITERIQSVIGTIQQHDSVERFCKLGAQVEFGESTFIDEHSIGLDGKTYAAAKWVISTGSSAFIPPIEGLDSTPYITNRDIFSLKKLHKSLVIIGAGPIGIEMGQSFNRLGSDVTVIDSAGQILNKEDKDMADMVMNVLSEEGVTFMLNSSIEKVSDKKTHREVVVRNASGETHTLKGETVLVSVGRKPNIEGLGLEKIGVELDRRGIKVDDRLRTRHSHIYGAGDVIGGFLFTHAAGYEGGVVVSNAVFHIPRKRNYSNIPWCTYTEPELANIGLNEKRAREKRIEFSVWTEQFSTNDRSLAEGEAGGMIKLLVDRKEKPIGIQILGLEAGNIISEWVAAMNGGVKLSIVASAIHPYPTLGEINKKVTDSLFAKKIFSEKVQKALKFFFSLKGRACVYYEEEGAVES